MVWDGAPQGCTSEFLHLGEGKPGHGGTRINGLGRSSGGLYVGIPVSGGGEAGPHRSEHGLMQCEIITNRSENNYNTIIENNNTSI